MLSRADSPVLGFDGVSDDPLRYPSPNFSRDLSMPSPRDAIYLDDDDDASVASNAAFDHVRALYAPSEPSSRWSTASSLLPPSPPPSPARLSRRKRLTSILSRLVALTSSTPPPQAPREMHKAYLQRDDPPIALDLRSPTSSTSTLYTCHTPPPVPPKSHYAPHIDYPDTPPDPDLGDLTCHTPPASPAPSLDPEPRRARIKRRLRQQQSMATLNSSYASTSSYDTDPGSPYWSYSHSSFSLSPPLSPIAFPSFPDPPPPPPHPDAKEKRPRRTTALKALSILPAFPFRPRDRSRTTSLLPPNPKRLTIRISGSPCPVDVVLPPSPRGPPPVPPKDCDDEYRRATGIGLDTRGRVVCAQWTAF